MAYIVNDPPRRRRNRRRPPLVISVVIVIAVAVAALIVVYRDDSAQPEPAPPAPAPIAPAITWTRVGPQPVPRAAGHGPTETEGGLAAGFSHDEMGAALAALNISARLSRQAGPAVYESTVRQQCFGDLDGTIAEIRDQRSNAPATSTAPTEVFYRITGGNPRSDLVSLSLALETPQSRGLGGYAKLDRTLRWTDGDWKVQVPPAPPQPVASVAGYSSLGRPNG